MLTQVAGTGVNGHNEFLCGRLILSATRTGSVREIAPG
jgi:hypothetical protein